MGSKKSGAIHTLTSCSAHTATFAYAVYQYHAIQCISVPTSRPSVPFKKKKAGMLYISTDTHEHPRPRMPLNKKQGEYMCICTHTYTFHMHTHRICSTHPHTYHMHTHAHIRARAHTDLHTQTSISLPVTAPSYSINASPTVVPTWCVRVCIVCIDL
jgi:hypothetical protein